MFESMIAEIQDNKSLVLKWPLSNEDKEEIKRKIKERGESSVWYDLFETYSCNGGFSPVNPESHFIGLTSDPYIIAEESSIKDNGDLTVYGKLWHCNLYMLESALESLIDKGEYTLQFAFDCENGESFIAHHNG